eukprot:CAMPEP_0178384576 /NCGR_PEP_ID=MMETSP0689_2-20121128/7585_1 /TAXON_ID=160604 /ORGANISM="Amphidinium massartii, Strain CS-259" /LENGTH=797 /DNA_ID=CAMNT_0020004825 /DNA_START=116 /DNA_END=2509 /DNA_ORIENTATION=+
MRFMSITTLSFDAPANSASALANAQMRAVFPGLDRSTSFVGMIVVNPPAQVLSVPGLRNFSFSLRAALNASHPLVEFQSNATLWYGSGVPAASGLVSHDGTITLLQWVIKEEPTSDAARHFATACEPIWDREVKRWLPEVADNGMVSVATLVNVGISDSETSLAKMDAIALPLAVLVLWYVVQSGRLLLFPLVTVGTSASLSFGLMYLVGHITIVETTTPSLMMSLLIAMSIDYSLFFLSRFRLELIAEAGAANDAEKVNEAIHSTMQTAGFTILLSGVTLTASFVTVAFFPVEVISSLGVGCSLSLLIALVVHLTLGPALLACFPSFFARSVAHAGAGSSCYCSCCRRSSGVAREGGEQLMDSGASSGSLSQASSNCWRWLAKVTTNPYCGAIIILVVAVATGAIGYPALRMSTADNLLMSTPRGTGAYHVYELLIQKFGAGGITPYRVLMEAKDGSSILQEKLWADSQLVLQEMQDKLPNMQGSQIQGMSYAQGTLVPWAAVEVCLQNPGAPLCNIITFAIDSFCNKARTAGYAQVTLAFDPLGVDGPDWLDDARSLLKDLEVRTGLKLVLSGIPADSLDTIASVYKIFPYMVAATLGVALLLLGIAFRSIVIPIRSVVSICLTLVWVYGTSTRVYQDGALDFLGSPGMTGVYRAQMWMLPVICFSIVVGICLDYDIFLLSRVTEFRENKASAREAIEQGLCSTGGIISAAGLIMAIAFAGLLFSSLLVVNGLAFYMVTAVLYDTLIVRCLLTPAAMGLLDRFNWWPSRLASVGHGSVASSPSSNSQQQPRPASA